MAMAVSVATARGLGVARRLGGRAALSLAAAPADAAAGRGAPGSNARVDGRARARAASASVRIEGAGGYLQHSRNGALADLRTRVPLRRGADDWELRVSVVPRAEQGWLEFSATRALELRALSLIHI